MSATLGLLDMPPDQMESIVRFMDVPTLCSMERSCKTLLTLSRQDDALLWQAIVERRWGPVRIPTAWNHEHLCSWIEAAGKRSDRARQLISAQTPTTWRQLLAHLETVVAEWLLVSVKQTVELLLLLGIVSRTDKQAEEPLGTGWHAVLRQVLSWAPLDAKRRITAFVCADWHPPGTLARFLAPMVISGSTPVVALRALLLRFPFLPIDAGAGADRVIGWFSREYVARNARHLGSLGLGLVPADVAHTAPEGEQLRAEDHLLAADGIAPNESTMVDDDGGDDDDDDDDSAVLDAAGTREAKMQRLAARCGLSRTEFQASRDAVYTLTYSVIMLNTDLHNPVITPKITAEEYIASCHRCVPLERMPDAILRGIHESLATHPLQIAPSVDRVHTAIRSSQQAEDIESGPTLSMYSSVTRHARAQPNLLDRHAAAMPGIANGGGAPNSARLSQTSELPEIDWRVAYWNLVDYCRQARVVGVRWAGLPGRARASRMADPPITIDEATSASLEVVQPSPALQPREVISIMMAAFHRDNFERLRPRFGCEVAMRFLAPSNPASRATPERFASFLQQSWYEPLLTWNEYEWGGDLTLLGEKEAYQQVRVRETPSSPWTSVRWMLKRVPNASAEQWMVEAVFVAEPDGGDELQLSGLEALSNVPSFAPANLSPRDLVLTVMRAVRNRDKPYRFHGCEVAIRYCSPSNRASSLSPQAFAQYLDEPWYCILTEWDEIEVQDEADDLGDGSTVTQDVLVRRATDDSWTIVNWQLSRYAGRWLMDSLSIN